MIDELSRYDLKFDKEFRIVEVIEKDVIITDARGKMYTKKRSRLTVHRYMFSSIYYLQDTKDRKFWLVSTTHPLDMWEMDEVIRDAIPKE